MLAYISWTTRYIEDGKITVTPIWSGLGYELLVPHSLLSAAKIGDSIEIYIHHHKTDVSETLFGFPSPEVRALFRKLLKVDGVGGKTALSLLNIGIRELVLAIESGDEKILSAANGVGKKTALKIIVELKKELTGESLFANDIAQEKLAPAHHVEIQDTLVQMGYDKKLVAHVIEKIPDSEETIEKQVIWSIRQLAGKI